MAQLKASIGRAFVCLAFLGLFSSAAVARESVPIVDYNDVSIVTDSGKRPNGEQVRNAIKAAASAKGWEIDSKQAGDAVSAKLDVRGKHSVSVSIPFSPEKFSIKYVSSTNMNYGTWQGSDRRGATKDYADGTPLIHPFYNKWVQTLRQEILRELKKL